MKKIKTHHKIGIVITLMGVIVAAASLAIPAISSYLVIAGIVLILVGCFVISPISFTPF